MTVLTLPRFEGTESRKPSLVVQGDCHLPVVTPLPLALAAVQLDSGSCVWNTTCKGRMFQWLLGHGISCLEVRAPSTVHLCQWFNPVHSAPTYGVPIMCIVPCIFFPEPGWNWRVEDKRQVAEGCRDEIRDRAPKDNPFPQFRRRDSDRRLTFSPFQMLPIQPSNPFPWFFWIWGEGMMIYPALISKGCLEWG